MRLLAPILQLDTRVWVILIYPFSGKWHYLEGGLIAEKIVEKLFKKCGKNCEKIDKEIKKIVEKIREKMNYH